jgi:hypothetical protein
LSCVLVVVVDVAFPEYSILMKAYCFMFISMWCFTGVILYGRVRYERRHGRRLKGERRLIIIYVGIIGAMVIFFWFFINL